MTIFRSDINPSDPILRWSMALFYPPRHRGILDARPGTERAVCGWRSAELRRGPAGNHEAKHGHSWAWRCVSMEKSWKTGAAKFHKTMLKIYFFWLKSMENSQMCKTMRKCWRFEIQQKIHFTHLRIEVPSARRDFLKTHSHGIRILALIVMGEPNSLWISSFRLSGKKQSQSKASYRDGVKCGKRYNNDQICMNEWKQSRKNAWL